MAARARAAVQGGREGARARTLRPGRERKMEVVLLNTLFPFPRQYPAFLDEPRQSSRGTRLSAVPPRPPVIVALAVRRQRKISRKAKSLHQNM